MKCNHKFEIGPNLSGLRIFKQLSIIGIFGVAFSLLSKGASLDANFIFGSFIIVIVIPCLISVISSFLLRRKPKSLLLVDSDYILIFEDGVMTASRRTKNFEGFEKYFLIPSDIMIFKEEGNVKLPATMANRCFHIFSCIKKSQSSEDIGKFHIFLAWFR
jgi:hypothetical protein